VFVPVEDAIEVLRAVTDAWQSDLRYRVSRAKARIKFMVDDLGPEGMRARVEERLGRRLEDGVAPEPVGDPEHLGARPQRQEGFAWLGVPVPAGRVSGTQLERLADLIEPLGADVRFTRQQNLIVGNVPEHRMPELRAGLAELDLDPDRASAYATSVACTSHRFCNYSVAETKEKLVEVLAHLEARFGAERLDGLRIHMDGCPHACAQHWIGEIGLQGTTAPSPDGNRRLEAYDLTLGGGLGARAGIGRSVLRRIPSAELEGVLERLVAAWLATPDAGSFGAFCDARTEEELARIAAGAPAPTEEAAQGPVVRIPGVLLALTDGADRIEVAAATVGEALAAVAARHPRFGEAVLPGGELAEAYLVVLNDEDVRGLEGLATPVAPGDEITVLVAMAGGSR
jgi:ferredoxin-nitrite reductase